MTTHLTLEQIEEMLAEVFTPEQTACLVEIFESFLQFEAETLADRGDPEQALDEKLTAEKS